MEVFAKHFRNRQFWVGFVVGSWAECAISICIWTVSA